MAALELGARKGSKMDEGKSSGETEKAHVLRAKIIF